LSEIRYKYINYAGRFIG